MIDTDLYCSDFDAQTYTMEVDYFLKCYIFSFHFALYDIASITSLLVGRSVS